MMAAEGGYLKEALHKRIIEEERMMRVSQAVTKANSSRLTFFSGMAPPPVLFTAGSSIADRGVRLQTATQSRFLIHFVFSL